MQCHIWSKEFGQKVWRSSQQWKYNNFNNNSTVATQWWHLRETKSTWHKVVVAFWTVLSLFNCATLAPIMATLPYSIIGLTKPYNQVIKYGNPNSAKSYKNIPDAATKWNHLVNHSSPSQTVIKMEPQHRRNASTSLMGMPSITKDMWMILKIPFQWYT